MKGMISGIKRMEIHDGDGIRTTVFFKGCPLKCIWCHNPESISFEEQIAFFEDKCIRCGACSNQKTKSASDLCPTGALVCYGEQYEVGELADILSADMPFFKNSNGGVTLSGGECLWQGAFASELAKNLSERGISVFVDTCGHVGYDAFKKIIPYTDRFLYDIKAINPDVHTRCTGKDNALILENLKKLSEDDCSIEIRYPLVVGQNDGECRLIGEFLRPLKGITGVKVLSYHSFAGSRYTALNMTNTLPDTKTTYDDVERAVEILKSCGINAINGVSES